MGLSSSRRQRGRSTPPSSKDIIDEFEACLSLYATLSWRFSRSAPFLPRTLRRSRPGPTHTVARAAPTVRYVAGHDDVKWLRKVSRMRCLWCARRFYRFADQHELMLHLRTCHGRFVYQLKDTTPENSKPPREITVYRKLLEGQEGSLATGVDRFSEPDEENLYMNPARYGPKREGGPSSSAGSKRPSSLSDDDRTPKRHRQSRECVATTPKIEHGKKLTVRRSAPDQQGGRKAKAAKSRGTSARVEKGIPVYRSVAHAVKEKRLWHSILQNSVTLDEFQAGDDSDEEREDEHEWKLKLADDEVEEFEDTLPVEKLLMNLWNQFLCIEFKAYADHRVALACKEFGKKYRRIIQKFNLEVTFLRHLTELARIGLLDSDTMTEIGMILRNRNEKPTNEEEGARFLFAERITMQSNEEAQEAPEIRNGYVS